MILRHADILDSSFEIKKDKDISIGSGRIRAILSGASGLAADRAPEDEESMDLSGLLLIPGLIDIHIHGAVNEDTSDASPEGLSKISRYLVSRGITSFCPTTMMIPEEQLSAVLRSSEEFSKKEICGAKMLGVRLEGPFLSKEKCGVQNSDFSIAPSYEYIQKVLNGLPEELISIIDLSPELPGAEEFIRSMKDKFVLSVAHTACTYACCRSAIGAGIRHGTHLFNAMNVLHHHQPGPVGALLEDPDVTCELICDGMHIHPTVLKLAIRILGRDRLVVVSDAMRAAGMPDGDYDLGGKTVHVKDGRTDFGDGRLAGSTTDILSELRNLVSLGISLEDAVKASSMNPAKVLRKEKEIGSIEEGKCADLVALTKDLDVKYVWVEGILVYEKDEGKENRK